MENEEKRKMDSDKHEEVKLVHEVKQEVGFRDRGEAYCDFERRDGGKRPTSFVKFSFTTNLSFSPFLSRLLSVCQLVHVCSALCGRHCVHFAINK